MTEATTTHVLVRTALAPWREYQELATAVTDALTKIDGYAKALSLATDFFASDLRKEALWLASPEVYDLVFVNPPNAIAEQQHLLRTLIKYAARTAGRATPFGLFAGVGTAPVVDAPTRMLRAEEPRITLRSRLDLGILARAARRTRDRRAAPPDALLFANPSWYTLDGKVRYAQSVRRDECDAVVLAAVDDDEPIRAMLKAAERGTSRQALATLLTSQFDATDTEAQAYLDELVAENLLEPQQLVVSGPTPLPFLMNSEDDALPPALAQTFHGVANSAALPSLLRVQAYERAASQLREHDAGLRRGATIQVDAYFPIEDGGLHRSAATELLQACHLLRAIEIRPATDLLREFKDKFEERFGEGPVPLSLALDPEQGLGELWGEPADQGVANDIPIQPAPHQATTRDPREGLLLTRVCDLAAANLRDWHLTPDDIRLLTNKNARPTPESFVAVASIAEIEGQSRLFLRSATGPSALRMLGRFCGVSPDIDTLINQVISAEERFHAPNCIAEIAHLPDDRMANIVFRPALRSTDIVLRGASAAARVLAIRDLMVALRNDTIYLADRETGRRVIPRMASAHNYWLANSTPAYRLLALLQTNGFDSGWRWRWADLDRLPFLPRVLIGNVMLSPRRWRWRVEENTDHAHAIKELAAFVARHNPPPWVSLVEGDTELPIDITSRTGQDIIVRHASARKTATFFEMLEPSRELAPSRNGNAYVHELILPFVAPPATTGGMTLPAASTPSCNEGAAWTYHKIYTSRGYADRLLTDTIAPILLEGVAQQAVDSFHFLRFADPEFHLRIRLRGEGAPGIASALQKTLQRSLRSGSVRSIAQDAYHPECRRYGGCALHAQVHTVFREDSRLAIAILNDKTPQPRWQYAATTVHRLLTDFEPSTRPLLQLLEGWRDGLAAELGIKDRVAPILATALRERLKQLAAQPQAYAEAIAGPLQDRTTAIHALRALHGRGEQLGPPQELLGSLAHMSINRILSSEWRRQEMVLYHIVRAIVQRNESRPAHASHR